MLFLPIAIKIMDILSALQVQDFSLHHVGSLELAECPAFSCVDDSEGSGSGGAVLDKMLPIIYRTRSGSTPHRMRASQLEQPLFIIAMEMKLDKERNSTVGLCPHCHF